MKNKIATIFIQGEAPIPHHFSSNFLNIAESLLRGDPLKLSCGGIINNGSPQLLAYF
ncbi:hypothetical protein [Polynucleobacter necessarius]|uniref:hypothetical protein n=1 Tax=Polynucleobacter necessarius TaxID=576610 RepID=UPI0013B05072|nr:hypothetical protein [Polynucleobacter necessarius]